MSGENGIPCIALITSKTGDEGGREIIPCIALITSKTGEEGGGREIIPLITSKTGEEGGGGEGGDGLVPRPAYFTTRDGLQCNDTGTKIFDPCPRPSV